MDADEIEAFLTLAEELHFTHTADRLHLAQPRVSRLIASLERRIGGALFERTSRRVTLTPLGASLRDQAGPAYAALRQALADAAASARGTSGTLRIGCTPTSGGPAVSQLAEEFSARHPDCELSLRTVDLLNPYTELRNGGIDVLVNWQAVDEPDLVAGPVLEYRDRVLAMRTGTGWPAGNRSRPRTSPTGRKSTATLTPARSPLRSKTRYCRVPRPRAGRYAAA